MANHKIKKNKDKKDTVMSRLSTGFGVSELDTSSIIKPAERLEEVVTPPPSMAPSLPSGSTPIKKKQDKIVTPDIPKGGVSIEGLNNAGKNLPPDDPFKEWFTVEMTKIKTDYDEKEDKIALKQAIEIMVNAITKWGAAKQGVTGLKFDKTDFDKQLARLDAKRKESRSDVINELGEKKAARVAKAEAKVAAKKGESELRKEYAGQKTIIKYNLMKSAEAKLDSAKWENPASHQVILYSFMGVVEPGGIVREGEQAMLKRTGGWVDRILGMKDSYVNGRFINKQAFEDFKSAVKDMVREDYKKNVLPIKKFYSKIATDYGYRPEFIIAEYSPDKGEDKDKTGETPEELKKFSAMAKKKGEVLMRRPEGGLEGVPLKSVDEAIKAGWKRV